MALALLPPLEKQKTKVTWVCGSEAAPLLQGRTSRLIIVNEKKLFRGNPIEWLKLWCQIGWFFDCVITAHVDWRYRLVSAFTWAKQRRVFVPTPGKYHAEEYARLVE